MEKIIRGTKPGTWRKPDVQGIFHGLSVAFEAQLSTTFLRVMGERRNFYLEQNAALVWVFKEFPRDSRRLLQDDVFYSNNRNVFIVSADTLAESRRRGCFVMLCLWLQPSLTDDRLDYEWREQLVCFDRLTIELERQRVYWFDCEGEASRLRKIAWEASWLGEFEHFWTTTAPEELRVYDAWQKIRQGHGRRNGRRLSRYPADEGALRGVLNGLYSMKVGRPVGWRFTTLIQVLHRSLGTSPGSLGVLARAVAYYERAEQLAAADKSGKLARKIQAMVAFEPGSEIDWNRISGIYKTSPHSWLLVQLFPELHGRPPFYLSPGKA